MNDTTTAKKTHPGGGGGCEFNTRKILKAKLPTPTRLTFDPYLNPDNVIGRNPRLKITFNLALI
jgi:hypothetical protein